MRVNVIIPAAGLGVRMHAASPAAGELAEKNPKSQPAKQFLELSGAPIIIHTLRKFVEHPQVDEIWVALRGHEMAELEERLASEKFHKPIHLAGGGDHRQQSVSNALDAIHGSGDDLVLVHDAVRPLVDATIISSVIAAALKYGAAIAGVPASDTVKQVERTSEGALITSTIPRERIVLAQTPQGFRYHILKHAFEESSADGFIGTDEASLAERAGHPVVVVMGSYRNLKITTPGDLELAEFLLRDSMKRGTP